MTPADDYDPSGSPAAKTPRWFRAMFLSLRGRLILLVCFATVPAILLIFIAAAREREAALGRMEADARHLAGLASREHAHQLNGARDLLRRLGTSTACGTGDAPAGRCPEYLPVLLSGFPQFANIGMVRPSGDVACSALPIHQAVDFSQNAAIARARVSDDVETGTYVISPFIARPVIHLAYAVRTANRTPCAVLFVAVELSWLEQLGQQANVRDDYSLFIVDRTGRVLARSGRVARRPGDDPPSRALADALPRPHGAVVNIGDPPVSRFLIATPMQGVAGIYVVAGLPFRNVQNLANRAFYRAFLGLLMVIVLAIGSAVVAAEFSVLRDLRALTRTVRRFGAGDLNVRAPMPGSHGELRELSISFGTMARSLAARQREAAEAQSRLRALSHRLQEARDEEAARIARELHDELGQILTGLKLDISGLRRICANDPSSLVPSAIAEMSEHVDRAIESVRRISTALRPAVLDRLGLAAAIDWIVREFEPKVDFTISLRVTDLGEPIDGAVSTAVFRVVQEALTNVARHAAATEVEVDLEGHPHTLTLRVTDNGVGIPAGAIEGRHSLGILGMRERVRRLAGTCQIESAKGRGTTVRVELPRQPPGSAEVVA